ncbi:MAG: hypothetical protein JJT75_08320 [Opitutales bacterium]|nr:hypothetical protein [Opitutales bacterium]MCH8541782.1 hypothetical protein [Opitutales bacterium]
MTSQNFLSVLECGAKPDGVTLSTKALQKAIDSIADLGGGTVLAPPGRYLTGMLRLRSKITFHLEAGAVLLASPNPEDSRPWAPSKASGDYWKHEEEGAWHLLYAEDCEDLTLSGPGILDGQGEYHYDAPPEGQLGWPLAKAKDGQRPGALVQISRCRRVRLQDIRLQNVANWTLHLYDSDHLQVRDIHINNPDHAPNADGIDITGCHYVTINGCHIDTCDDAICLKTFDHSRTCENVTVSNCVLKTSCVALKLGCVESVQDMRNVTFSNCTVTGSSRGVGLYSVHGGVLENISITNIVCDTKAPLMFTRPIHLDLRKSTRSPNRPGGIRNVLISGMVATTNGRCLFTGDQDNFIENLILRDIQLIYPTVDDPARTAETYGGSQFSPQSPWARTTRAALVFDKVRECSLEGIQIQWPQPGEKIDPVWTPPAKIANGDHHLFQPADWALPEDTIFRAVAVKNSERLAFKTDHLTEYKV